MRTGEFDPLAYIESAFFDAKKPEVLPDAGDLNLDVPTMKEFMAETRQNGALVDGKLAVADGVAPPNRKFRKTTMSAPRPRRQRPTEPRVSAIDPELQQVWETLPKSLEFLCSFYDDAVTANYYRGEFKESRAELVRRLLDPELTLEETARLLGVCPATVRRYTNRQWLKHDRTNGGQRRFRLSHVVRFVEEHGRFPEE